MTKARGLVAFVVIPLLLFGATSCGGEKNAFAVKSELVTAAERPIALAFAPDGRLFYAEQYTGNIRVISAEGQLLTEPFAHIDVAVNIDWGLTGLAMDPDFQTNHYIYAYYTEVVDTQPITAKPVVVRFKDESGRGVEPKVIVGDLPVTFPERPGLTTIGSIGFGQDGLLYLTVGDYDRGKIIGPSGKPYAQDLASPLGKMLRVNKETGSAAPGNPFLDRPDADPRIFAYGFYQPFPFAVHPETGMIYGADNTASCEELNVIETGANYGWPDVGEFPFSDCRAGSQKQAIYFLAKEGSKPGDFLSVV